MSTLTETPVETPTETSETLSKITRICLPDASGGRRMGGNTFIVQCQNEAGVASRKLSAEACGALQEELKTKLGIGSIVLQHDPRISGASISVFDNARDNMATVISYFQGVLRANGRPDHISVDNNERSL